MKKVIEIFVFGIISLFMITCQSKKNTINLESKFYTDSIYSEHLSEYRKHNIYLPKRFNTENKYPIIYATDGSDINGINFFKETLDSLISNNIIKPTLLIVSHSNNKIADSTSMSIGDGKKGYLQFRNFEYINDYASVSKDSLLVNRFKNHMLYFKEELISKTEKEFNLNINKEDSYFYGVSNGAGFGLSLLNTYPNIIGNYLCFSTFGGDIQSNTWREGVNYPNLYLNYGSKEPLFLKEDAAFLKSKYKELNLYSEIKEFEGGHDYKIWNEKFIKTISKLIGN